VPRVEFLDFWGAVGRALWGVFTLDRSTAEWFAAYPASGRVALTVALLAGISTLLGNSAVLFFNRVRGFRFVFSLVLSGLGMIGLYMVQAFVLGLVGDLIVGHEPVAPFVVRGMLLSTAPMVFGVLALIPYFGPAIARFLQVWSLVALWVIVQVLYGTGLWPALLVTLVAWGSMQLISWALARPVAYLGGKIWRLVTGSPIMLTGRDLLSGHPFMPVESRPGQAVPR